MSTNSVTFKWKYYGVPVVAKVFLQGGSNFMLWLRIKGSLLAPKSTIKFPLISGKTGLSQLSSPLKPCTIGIFEQSKFSRKKNKTKKPTKTYPPPPNTNPKHTNGFCICLLTPHNHILDTLIKKTTEILIFAYLLAHWTSNSCLKLASYWE